MVDFPIVDTHLHVWDPDWLSYPWLADVPFLNRAYSIEDFRVACDDVPVEKLVFVQAEADFELYQKEVDWVTSVAGQDPRIEAIVAWAPLELGDRVDPILLRLVENRLLRGIRRIIEFEEDQGFCIRPDFVRGVRALAPHNLSFDICVNHSQLPNAIRMVEQCPDVRFVLDHIGKPDIKNRVLDPWRENLKTMSDFPNVWCKMSGLVTEANMESWTLEDLRPYIDHVISCFGFARVMYGGDWPVAYQATDYPRWVETLSCAVQRCSNEEKRLLFHDNGMDFYRLPGDALVSHGAGGQSKSN